MGGKTAWHKGGETWKDASEKDAKGVVLGRAPEAMRR